MSIPTDFSPDDDPVLSDERLTDDSDTREEYALPPKTQMQKAAAARAINSMGDNTKVADISGIGVETAITREEAMQTRTPPRNLQYSDLFRQGMPLNMSRAQPKERYGARTQAALKANIEKTRFMGNAPGSVSSYLERPASKITASQPDKARHGRQPDLGAVEPTTKAERLGMAVESPRYAHQDITDDEMWRDLMEESPAHTAGTRSSFDSLLSPRGGRAASRAQTDPVLDNVPENRLDRAFGRRRLWPGSVNPNTPDLPPPPPPRRGRPRKQL
jgi:hypothetical protein